VQPVKFGAIVALGDRVDGFSNGNDLYGIAKRRS
jgi:hypothetical protein